MFSSKAATLVIGFPGLRTNRDKVSEDASVWPVRSAI
jgi:hypothetical protein